MATLNSSNTLSSTFYLTGIPGYEEFHHWISILFCLLYLVGIMGNCTILLIIQTDPRLHEPMYYFLAMLSLTDMGMSMPTMISLFRVLWSIAREIQFNVCVVQMFFIHTFSFTESSLLLVMALDWYVSICHPLRYVTILTPRLITKIGIAAVLRSAFAMIPLLARFPFVTFCCSHILSHSFCLHQHMIRLACADTKFDVVYGFVLITVFWGMDSLGIFVSYIFILYSVLRISSHKGRLKALNMCIPHLCCTHSICAYDWAIYCPSFCQTLLSHHLHLQGSHVLISSTCLNPTIYRVKTKQICQGILHWLLPQKIRSTVM